MNKLLIRAYGDAELIQFRTFNKVDWEELLIKNNISSNDIIQQMHDPNFFELYNFPNPLHLNRAQSKNDFFGNNFVYGPLYNQMAIVEIKYARKKLFRGTLNKFLGTDTFFPLVNLNFDSSEIEKHKDLITICSIEKTAGQIVNLFTKSDAFNADAFSVNVSEIKLENFNFKLVSRFNYISHPFKTMKLDQVVRKQWGFLI